jgi:hypothetical protein
VGNIVILYIYYNSDKKEGFMKKLSVFLAVALFAMFFVSCSSGGGGGSDDGNGSSSSGGTSNGGSGASSVDVSGLPTQLYLDMEDEEYNGNGDIIIVYDSDTLSAGEIKNGKVVLNLPDLNSEYLREMPSPCDDENITSCNFTLSPNDLTSRIAAFKVLIPGKTCHYLRLYVPEGSAKGEADFTYFSKAGRMEGTYTIPEDDEGYTWVVTMNVNFSQGWSISWVTHNVAGNTVNTLISTNTTQAVKNSVRWQALCTGG